MFSFASKMLNTIMGTEEGQQPGGVPGQGPGFGIQQTRPLDPSNPQTRPSGPNAGARPYGAPMFSGPRPNPGLVRGGPPAFGGPPRPMTGSGTPHRFNGPQPPQPMHRGLTSQSGQQQFRGPGPAPPSMVPSGGQQAGLPMRPRAPHPRQPFQQQQKAQPHLPPPGNPHLN